MTIHLPEELARYVHDQVQAGLFLSENEVVADALERHRRAQPAQQPQPVTSATPQPDQKPIWEVIDELRASIPAEEWEKLPTDSSRQLKHYLYGSPKRANP